MASHSLFLSFSSTIPFVSHLKLANKIKCYLKNIPDTDHTICNLKKLWANKNFHSLNSFGINVGNSPSLEPLRFVLGRLFTSSGSLYIPVGSVSIQLNLIELNAYNISFAKIVRCRQSCVPSLFPSLLRRCSWNLKCEPGLTEKNKLITFGIC